MAFHHGPPSPLSPPLKPTQITKRSQGGAQPLYSRLYFSHDWSELGKKKIVAATLTVYTQIFTYYIFIFGVQQQQQRQTKEEEEKKDDIPLPSCCQIAIGEIETQPTDQTPDGKEERKRAGEKMMMMAISR